jgi:pimeloyl-ACP methyl ester carboxylesterase
MKENEAILKRQASTIRFKNSDMDFMLNWAIGTGQIVGLSASQVFYAVHDVKDGDPKGWRDGFTRLGNAQIEQAQQWSINGQAIKAGQFFLGAAYAYRAALQYTNPFTQEFSSCDSNMEEAFQKGVEQIGIPIRPVEIPFEGTTLPGYFLEHDTTLRPTVLMVGGGDTFREDLFYFAGYPGWKRGYNVLMVDLPGQGITPNRGLHFRADMNLPIVAILNWLEENAIVKPSQVAIYGVSGGGYFTAQAVSNDSRIKAWIAATPIYDMAKLFRVEFGAALKTPGWLMNTILRLSGSVNQSAEISLGKYAWQFGTSNFKTAIDQVLIQANIVDFHTIFCPSLFLISEGEAPELQRQAHEMYEDFVKRGVNVNLQEFTASQGADGHCELNNLRFAHMVIFDWLDNLFSHDPGDIRLRF